MSLESISKIVPAFSATICMVSLNLVLQRVGRVKIYDLSTWVDESDPSDPYPAGNLSVVSIACRIIFSHILSSCSRASSLKRLTPVHLHIIRLAGEPRGGNLATFGREINIASVHILELNIF